MLTRLAAHEGLSQQALGGLIGLTPTRMVFLVDELGQRGLVERRRSTVGRRSYAPYLTPQGRDTLRQIQAAATGHAQGHGPCEPAHRPKATSAGPLQLVAERARRETQARSRSRTSLMLPLSSSSPAHRAEQERGPPSRPAPHR